VDAQFGALEGIIRTRAGYAGGTTPKPDYGHIGDHTEAVQVDYDPERITYADLLEIFWKSHQPTSHPWKRQYLNAVFYHDAHQQEEALASKAALENQMGRSVQTEVLPLRSFTRAEDYHQKYLLKREGDLVRDLTRVYPRHQDLVDSTAAARLNGYAGGYGSPEQLSREIDRLGLSPAGREKLEMLVHRKGLFN
jgi:peptide-methionine (S)-S-oxide reductase